MPSVAQLISFLIDYGLDLESAIHLPRIDVSGGEEVIADVKLGAEVHQHLAIDHPVIVAANAVLDAALGFLAWRICSHENDQPNAGLRLHYRMSSNQVALMNNCL